MSRGASIISWLVVSCAVSIGACGTVELGDNFVAPPIQLDEDFFYCRVQPEVLTQHSCANGNSGENGMCHSARSALRLISIDPPDLPACDAEDHVLDPIPPAATDNFEAIRFTVQGSALSSPLYLRPVNRASHPRRIFPEDDPAAELIITWISQGAQ